MQPCSLEKESLEEPTWPGDGTPGTHRNTSRIRAVQQPQDTPKCDWSPVVEAMQSHLLLDDTGNWRSGRLAHSDRDEPATFLNYLDNGLLKSAKSDKDAARLAQLEVEADIHGTFIQH
ncbi:hypothetical protein ON010_g14432 [Phytophthora cinnamomi]|nr:hypothetical protein ON010_g14432 [Phytophthora cinnamomi]